MDLSPGGPGSYLHLEFYLAVSTRIPGHKEDIMDRQAKRRTEHWLVILIATALFLIHAVGYRGY
ncbi:hypothetical protein BOW51_09735 [Solemya velesiana gill symbiont]|uniref:Uncharacterized protein n=1 Tax=Solemya velesiana gill symbiont TaxID=1918948 RepID=A0A1T2KST8_9GAMM|nr:hypothetical protein BOW51_09735 [Solemya velesiana gill symbiont]